MSVSDTSRVGDVATIPSRARFAGSMGYAARRVVDRIAARVPVLRRNLDRPRTEPLQSTNRGLMRWMRAEYGSPGKPAALAEVPWDYVRAHEEEIPFLGLRESWYPALTSDELRHNQAVPSTLLGDALVFFRDADGRARALEDRCPHRSPLLSLGQVGVVRPGTITCRYHGMTFDGAGECVAVITDGPDSPACGKIRARTYPVEELGGVVWVYMGEESPKPVIDSLPHAREVFRDGDLFADRGEWPFSHLNTLDNDLDLAHPAVLHRTCLPFSDQKIWGRIGVEEPGCGGLRVHFRDGDDRPHAGPLVVNEVDWHLPNLAYFAPGTLGGPHGCGYFWAVPREVGSCARWFLFGGKRPTGALGKLAAFGQDLFFGRVWRYPGSPLSCSDGADAAMMASQGRVAQWPNDQLIRTDVAIVAARRKLKKAYAAERAASRAGAPEA